MSNFDAILINYLITAFSLLLISCPTLLILSKFNAEFRNASPYLRVTLSFAVGFAFLVLTTFMLGKSNFSVVVGIQLLTLPSCISIGILIAKRALYPVRSDFKIIFLSALVGTFQFIPGILKSNSNLTTVTHYNNDIAAYIGWTNEFLKTGFNPSNHISGVDLNGFALNLAYHGPTTMLSYVASIFNLKSWQVATPTMGICIAIALISLSRLMQAMYPNLNNSKAFLGSTIIVMSSLLTYIQLNYFLGQVIAISVSAMLASNALEYLRNHKSRKLLLYETVALTILAIFCYPAFLIPYMALCVIFLLLFWLYTNKFNDNSPIIKYILFLTVGIILSIPYLRIALNLGGTLASGEYGWKLAPINPLNAFLFPQTIGIHLAPIVTLVMWVLFFTLILFLFRNTKLETSSKWISFAILIVFPVSLVSSVLFSDLRLEDYKIWKLQSYFFPILLACIIPLITKSRRFGTQLLIFGICLTQSSSLLLWNSNHATFASRDLQNLRNDPRITELESLNIKLAPYFETMMAAAIIDRPKIYFNSVNAYQVSSDPNACVLVHLKDTTYPYVQTLNSSYGLASSSKEVCSSKEPASALGKKISFDVLGQAPNGYGWSSPESWGTWSIGKEASLDLKVIVGSAKQIKMKLESYAFVPPGYENQFVNVFANKIKIGEIRFTPSNNLAERNFSIMIDQQKGAIQNIELKFVIESPRAPSSLGGGGDSRELGLGLIAITFDKVE